jgi:hypothetical protein
VLLAGPSPGGRGKVTLWVYGNIITGGQLDGVISQLSAHTNSFDSISYQCYGVGDDGSFQANHPYGVPANAAEQFRARLGVETWPVISAGTSYDPFAKLFSDPALQESFIQTAINEAHAHGITGCTSCDFYFCSKYLNQILMIFFFFFSDNVDWEVNGQWANDPWCHDTITFLTTFANRLHQASIGISIDLPSGSSVCSPDSTRLLAQLPADRLITMGTYSATSPTVADFNRYLVDGLAAFGSRFAVGLDAVDAPFLSQQDVQKEFQLASSSGLQEICVWFYSGTDSIKEPWWTFMAAFRTGSVSKR